MADERSGIGGARVSQTDWATRATAAVESFVKIVRDKSLRPALLVVQLIFIAMVVAALGTLILVLGVIGIVRLLTDEVFGGRVWASDLLVGALLTTAGAVLFRLSRRTMKADSHV